MNELALFAGAGGGILGGKLLGWRTVCAVEWNAYTASVLCARQNEGVLPPFPIWDDVQTFDGHPWRGIVDVVSGGFPCQDISSAGRGAGIEGEKSSMWRHMARIIGEVRPRFAFVENSPMLTSRGLGQVLGDLAALGYDAEWGVLGAHHAGAPHKRDRIWIVAADANRNGKHDESVDAKMAESSESLADSFGFRWIARGSESARKERRFEIEFGNPSLADADQPQCNGGLLPGRGNAQHSDVSLAGSWWRYAPAEIAESGVGRMADGVAARVDRLKAIGNGQVPAVAALAWRVLTARLDTA